MKSKNIDILEHIRNYCEDIEAAIGRFGKLYENVRKGTADDAVSFLILCKSIW